MSLKGAERKRYHACRYCSGLRGDVNVHKAVFVTWTKKKNIQFNYHKPSNTLYIQTEVGFWKVFQKDKLSEYLLYHRNAYSVGMAFSEAIHGEFHRQSEVKATESLDKLVEYIIAHDRAKGIIMNDYRKLPNRTKKQKKYYRATERRDRRQTMRRLDSLWSPHESKENGLRKCSFC